MRNISLITLKEFRSQLTSPMAYVIAGVFLLLMGALFIWYLQSTQYADTSLTGYMGMWGNIVLMLFAAALTMRLIAEEKKLGTWELLLTAPVRDTEIVLGKFLGSFMVLLTMLGLTLYFPLLLIVFGDPDIGPIVTSYLGLILLGMASLSVGLFASSVTSNQAVAGVIAGGTLGGVYFIGLAGGAIGGPVGELISYISLSSHFPDFMLGIIDTKAVIYYLSVTALFLFLTVRSLETSRWG